MKIGDLARTAQCTVETVRYYEREGLLPAPARTAGNFRDYGRETSATTVASMPSGCASSATAARST